jgi:hypothetical protein
MYSLSSFNLKQNITKPRLRFCVVNKEINQLTTTLIQSGFCVVSVNYIGHVDPPSIVRNQDYDFMCRPLYRMSKSLVDDI